MARNEPAVAELPYVAAPRASAISPLLSWRRWLLPSATDCAFIFVIWQMFAAHGDWSLLLVDGDTGWHIRTGQYILSHHSVPHQDLFSFSRPGAPWFAWEWLSDVLLAALFSWGGLKAIVLAAAVAIGALPVVLLRSMASREVNGFVAWVVTMLAVGAAAIHFLARPHLFTLLLLPLALWILESDRRRAGRVVWVLIPLVSLWVNLHGGFVIFLGLLALLAAGSALEALLWRGKEGWSSTRRYTALFALCSLASLANPYGWGLHRHIFEFIASPFIQSHVAEFQSPSFHTQPALLFEPLLFAGLACAGLMLARRRLTEPLWIAALSALALNGARHVPLCAVALAPLIAEELTAAWRRQSASQARKQMSRMLWDIGDDLRPAFASSSFIPVIFVICLTFFVPFADWPSDFPSSQFPVAIVRKHQSLLARSKVLTSDQWGDYLIFLSYPVQRVYIDGRSDFYGPASGQEYLALTEARSDWRNLLKKGSFDLILCPVEWPLAKVLKESLNWRVAEDDGIAILFEPAPSK